MSPLNEKCFYGRTYMSRDVIRPLRAIVCDENASRTLLTTEWERSDFIILRHELLRRTVRKNASLALRLQSCHLQLRILSA